MIDQTQFYPRLIFVFIILLASCGVGNAQGNNGFSYVVEEAEDWTALFHRTSGWFGGDGIFAIPLDGKENQTADSSTQTMIIFSDTMIGEIQNGQIKPGESMVHNSVAYLYGTKPKEGKIDFHWAKHKSGEPQAFFSPQTVNAQKGDYYWLGESPIGPFGPMHAIYETKEMKQKNHITYNAKAHPHVSAPGELLISYNVNAFDFGIEIQAHPNLYRPRFINLKFGNK